ncbi:HNH endonuclease [Bacillus phage PBC2]|uniref:Putative AP2 domain-containing protein n=1 Tax=Bacillus phage PBC2 TaxID=1675029 RepID=A0A218KBR8_9CAUD|nr:HNH endonuclease [Bacillus phage PBC2]AKQ08337.1 putative AP2 domain-containing protein [Bacillus phage PBC2]
MSKGEERLGEIRFNKFGSEMKIVEYNNAHDVWVEFEHGNRVHTEYKHFKKGVVKNPYDKSVFNVGCLGEGLYKSKINYKYTPQYISWRNMMMRCYDKKFHEKQSSYSVCSVAEEWHNFQNFAKWYDENYYEIEGQSMHLDKDILVKGNNIYSPDKCVFVPRSINIIFTKREARRGELPIGVCFDKITEKYQALCNNGNGKQAYLGRFHTPEESFKAYKGYKEDLIMQVAEQYKSMIPQTLYDALISYKVEIND